MIYEGNIASLRRFKDDVKEVLQGYECGIGLDKFQDIKQGDILEGYTIEEIKRVLIRNYDTWFIGMSITSKDGLVRRHKGAVS